MEIRPAWLERRRVGLRKEEPARIEGKAKRCFLEEYRKERVRGGLWRMLELGSKIALVGYRYGSPGGAYRAWSRIS